MTYIFVRSYYLLQVLTLKIHICKERGNFNAGKTQLVSFDRSNNIGAIDVKMMCLFLRKNHLLRCWG